LNVWHGGTLYQDLESERNTTLHKGKDEKDLHGVTVTLDTRLARVDRLDWGKYLHAVDLHLRPGVGEDGWQQSRGENLISFKPLKN
jgi:hypothetical protein